MTRKQIAAELCRALKAAGYKSSRNATGVAITRAAAHIKMDDKQLGQILRAEVSPSLDTIGRILGSLNLKIAITEK